jgi:hypothetical protein
MLRHVTRVSCMLFEVVSELYLTNVATDSAHAHCKQDNGHKVVFGKYNLAITSKTTHIKRVASRSIIKYHDTVQYRANSQ